MADTKILLWTDFESTGLLDQKPLPTMLEVAWGLTDPSGVQLTPLSQAFCALTLDGSRPITPQPTSDPETELTVGYWEHEGHPVGPVREMHEHNGLVDEWINTPEDGILRSWPELERLILDDLVQVRWHELGRHEVQLAGGGVANYEARFLPALLPRVFGNPRMHYRAHDTSVALSVMRVRSGHALPGNPDRLIAGLIDQPGLPADWPVLATGRRYAANNRNGHYASTGEPAPHWARLEKDDHRAAVGVGRAIMAHRLLPYIDRAVIEEAPAEQAPAGAHALS